VISLVSMKTVSLVMLINAHNPTFVYLFILPYMRVWVVSVIHLSASRGGFSVVGLSHTRICYACAYVRRIVPHRLWD
jgi:hypothetical protein